MDEKLLYQLRLLKQYIDILNKIKLKDRETFLKDEILYGAAERYLQLAIETCINIGNRILSNEQFKINLKPIETYSDIFEGLYLLNIIDKEFSGQLKSMAKFRNRLVHVYWEIDHNYIYDLLQNNLQDLIKFLCIISEYVNTTNYNL